MGTSISNSFNPDFFALQGTAENTQSTTGTPDKPAQNQGSGGVPAAPGSSTSAYASLQTAQTSTGQNINSTGQNINATLGQVLGATQDSMADPSLSTNDNDTSSTDDEGALQAAIAGLSNDQQVVAREGGAKGKKDGHSGGGHSTQGEGVYMGTAASGLQKGEGTKSSTAVSSTQLSSQFTLKVDTSTSTSSTSSTSSSTSSTSSSTSYVDTNGAPALPPGPNVFGMVAESGELSSTLQLNTVSDMVAANNGMNNTLAQKYSTEITDIQKYVAAKNSANNKSSVAKAFSWVVNIAMIVVGCVTADPMLIGAGIAGCIMTADPKLANELAGALTQMFPGMPKQVANIMATLIIVAAACVATGGVAAVGEMAADMTTVAVRVAIDAAEDGADAGTESATTTLSENTAKDVAKKEVENSAEDSTLTSAEDSSKASAHNSAASENAVNSARREAFSKEGSWSDWASDTTRFKNAMASPKGRAAFQASIKDQMVSGANSIWTNISKMTVASIVDTALDSMASGARSLADSAKNAGESMYDAGVSVMKAAQDPLEAMNTSLAAVSKVIAKLAGRTSSEDDALAEDAASAKETSSLSENIQQAAQKLYNNLATMSPVKIIQMSAELTMAVLTTTGQVMQYNATKLKKIAIEDQANLLRAKAATVDINDQIALSSSQINDVLGDMNASITAAGDTLANMSQLSSETLGQLHGSAA
ncbi:MAG: hypothetical protein FJ390_02270 [Verrucomicrobia bacterium]|nr:hypothetical protein [Verrucomicrobiota bacterium]